MNILSHGSDACSLPHFMTYASLVLELVFPSSTWFLCIIWSKKTGTDY